MKAKQTAFRLSLDAVDAIQRIKRHFELSSDTDAVEYALRETAKHVGPRGTASQRAYHAGAAWAAAHADQCAAWAAQGILEFRLQEILIVEAGSLSFAHDWVAGAMDAFGM